MARQKSIDKETLRIFWRELYREKKLFWQSLCAPVSRLLINVLTPLLLGRMIASLVLPDSDPFSYVPWLVGIAALGILTNRIGFRAFLVSQAKTLTRLQLLGYDALTRRSIGFHNNRVSGKLVSEVMDYPAAFGQIHGNVMERLLALWVILLSGTIFVFIESWQLGLIILSMTTFVLISSYFSSKWRRPARKLRRQQQSKMIGHLGDSIVNMPTVTAFAAEGRERSSQKQLAYGLRDLRVEQWSRVAIEGNYRISVLVILQIALACVLVINLQNNPELLGIGIFAFIFTTTLITRLFEFDEITRLIEEALMQAQPVTEILLEDAEIKDKPNAGVLQVGAGQIEFDDVTFAYSDAADGDHVFRNLSLSIRPGEKVGLVGSSGGGKSTLTRLLLRFEDVQKGVIAIDGQSIADVTQHSLRQNIGYVPQEPLLFHRTIAENIAYGKPKAAQQDVLHAAKQAYAHEFITQLQKGYDTVVGERGVKLSGGQRQRIAIARAILKDAPILLLDEATSALDSESELYIQKALAKLMQDKTTIVIAHRLSTIQRMDRIVVLDEGKIVEQGSHKELLAKKGTYAKLWAHQSGGFIEE